MLIEMELREILMGQTLTPTIILGEKDGQGRQFPILIRQFEAECLEMAVRHAEYPRPLTHDLIFNVIHGLGGSLRRIIIDKLEKETFYGKLDIEMPDSTSVWIDSRPSDAIILAAKVSCPIYADEEVLIRARAEAPSDEEEAE